MAGRERRGSGVRETKPALVETNKMATTISELASRKAAQLVHFSPTCDQSQQRNEHVATLVQEVEAHGLDRIQRL